MEKFMRKGMWPQYSFLPSPGFQGNIKTVTSENIYNLSRERTGEDVGIASLRENVHFKDPLM